MARMPLTVILYLIDTLVLSVIMSSLVRSSRERKWLVNSEMKVPQSLINLWSKLMLIEASYIFKETFLDLFRLQLEFVMLSKK